MLRSYLRLALALIGVAILTAGAAPTAAQEPFYKGKRLSMLINFGPGALAGGLRQSGRGLCQFPTRPIPVRRKT